MLLLLNSQCTVRGFRNVAVVCIKLQTSRCHSKSIINLLYLLESSECSCLRIVLCQDNCVVLVHGWDSRLISICHRSHIVFFCRLLIHWMRAVLGSSVVLWFKTFSSPYIFANSTTSVNKLCLHINILVICW